MENNKLKSIEEELSDEINCYISLTDRLKAENEALKSNIKDLQCKTEEIQKALDYFRTKSTENLCIERGTPIEMAQKLIDLDLHFKNMIGREYSSWYYSKSELKQIAEHLLVYVNNSEDSR